MAVIDENWCVVEWAGDQASVMVDEGIAGTIFMDLRRAESPELVMERAKFAAKATKMARLLLSLLRAPDWSETGMSAVEDVLRDIGAIP